MHDRAARRPGESRRLGQEKCRPGKSAAELLEPNEVLPDPGQFRTRGYLPPSGDDPHRDGADTVCVPVHLGRESLEDGEGLQQWPQRPRPTDRCELMFVGLLQGQTAFPGRMREEMDRLLADPELRFSYRRTGKNAEFEAFASFLQVGLLAAFFVDDLFMARVREP